MADLADAVGVGVGTIHRVIRGTTARIDASTAAAVFAVPCAAPSPGGLVDSCDARAALDALRAGGWTYDALAEELELPAMTLQRLARQEQCTRRVADAITSFHDNFYDVNDGGGGVVDDDYDDPLAALRWVVDDATQSWRASAACRSLPGTARERSEVFFPAPGDNAGVDAARAVCAGCAVRVECLAFAMAQHRDAFEVGVFGGTSGAERRAIRHQERTESTERDALDDAERVRDVARCRSL